MKCYVHYYFDFFPKKNHLSNLIYVVSYILVIETAEYGGDRICQKFI